MNLSAPHKLLSEAEIKAIPLWKAWAPILILIGLLAVNVRFYGENATSGPNQLALLFAAAVAVLVGQTLRVPFTQMLDGIKASIHSAMTAMLILLIIGALIGTWVISGIVPSMIYYGLEILDAKIFLAASVVVCSIASVATGSSWSTVGTVGLALLGIGEALGVPPAYTAGAIISGSYFGDKISPLSDTTNLAAAMAGTDLITHIRYMMYTTVPSILLTIGIFAYMGYSGEATVSIAETAALQKALAEQFNLTPFLFLVPIAVLVMVALRVDALKALFIGTLLGALFAVIFQAEKDVVGRISGILPLQESKADDNSKNEVTWFQRAGNHFQRNYMGVINAMGGEVALVSKEDVSVLEAKIAELKQADERAGSAETAGDLARLTDTATGEVTPRPKGPEVIELEGKLAAAKLCKSKGMIGMLNTFWLVTCAMCFGGVMEACGLLQRITASLLHFAHSTFSLFFMTVASCLFLNVTASDQYLSIVVAGRMFRQPFKDRGLAPQNLSRSLEDCGTVTSVLVPWNTCGAMVAGTLGISSIGWVEGGGFSLAASYAPFCFFNWISPLMTLLFALIGIKIARLPKA